MSTAPTFRVAINPHFTDKVAQDAPDQVWGAFNNSFQSIECTLDELAAHIQQGKSITADCSGKRKTENFIARQELGLDFDTRDARSSLDTLRTHPFIAQYAALIHTTASHRPEAPRARALFLLDKPVTDPNQYREYAQALIEQFGTSDAQCHDPARIWFGARGCDIRQLGNILPCSIMDQLVAQWKASQRAAQSVPQPQTPSTPTIDAHELLDWAIREGTPGSRNSIGFLLACRLRDAGYIIDAACERMLIYQQSVERTGNHPYLVREATDSLASAYSHKPQHHIDATIDAIERAVVDGTIRVSANVQKTLFAILSIMRRAGKTKDIAMSLRSIERAAFGFVDKSTVSDHLTVLVDAGLLAMTRKSDHRGGTSYTLMGDLSAKSGHSQQGEHPLTAMSVQTLRIDSYHALQAEAINAIRAQVHPKMARSDDELRHSFGSSTQRILAVLQSLPDGADSLETLGALTFLSKNTVSKKVGYLAAHQIVDIVHEGNRRRVKLNRFWHENIEAITPALTSFGQDLLRAERSAKQQIAHHEHMAHHTANADNRAMSEATIERAEQMVEFLQVHKDERLLERRQWMQNNGVVINPDPKFNPIPPLSLHPRSNPKGHKPVIHVNGRDLTPGAAATDKPNGRILAELVQPIVVDNDDDDALQSTPVSQVTMQPTQAPVARPITNTERWQKSIAIALLSEDFARRKFALTLNNWLNGVDLDRMGLIVAASNVDSSLLFTVNWALLNECTI